MKNFLSKLWSLSRTDRVRTLAIDVVSLPSFCRVNMLKLCSVLAILLTVGVGNVWGLVASEVADTKATSITDGDKFIIATAKTSGYYLTSTVTSNWGVCTTTLGSATIYTAHGTGSSFYLTCDEGTLVPNNSSNFQAYNSGATANLKLSGSGDILNKSSDTYKLRRNTGSPGGGRWYTGSTGTAMYLFKVTITPKKVTYNAGSGTCKSSDTELVGGEGLTLASASPSASCASAGWVFAGWKQTSAQTETTSIPTLIPGGSTYYPSTDETLYAVYRLGAVYAIDFESTAGTYTDWTFSSITSQGTNSNVKPHGGTKIGLTANSNGNYASVKTKAKIAAPKAIKFYISKVSTNTTASYWQVYTSTDGSTWTSRKSQDAKSMNQGVWVEVSQDLSSYTNVYVKVEYGTSNAVRCIDDLILSCATYNSNPSCCTSLGTLNGSVSWSGGNATVSWDAAGGCSIWGLKYKRHADSDIPANWTIYAGSFGTATGRTSNSTAISGLTAGTEYDFQISGTSDGSVYCSGSVGQTVSSTVPKITTSSSMTDLGYQEGETPVAQTFTITGTQLTGNLTVTAPSNFLVSLDGSSWSAAGGSKTVTVSTPPNNLGSTTIHIKANSGLLEGADPSGNITISGGGAASVNVAVSATITEACTAPSSVSISGTTKYFGGQTISLTATPSGGVGETSYQWQKKISGVWTDVANGNGISGATSNNLQISSCTHSNSGGYRCIVSTGSTCSTKSHADNTDGYGVHVFSVYGGYVGESWSDEEIAFTSGTTGTATVHLNSGTLYKFHIRSNNGAYYCNGTADYNGDGNADGGTTDGWYVLKTTSNISFGRSSNNYRIYTGPEGDYTITVDIANALTGGDYVTVGITYPTVTQHPVAGYTYFEKPSEWTNVYLYWYTDDNSRLSGWSGTPEITQTTTICGTTYYYTPLGTTFSKVIFKGNGTNQWPGDGYTTTGCSGKYMDKTAYASPAWAAFPTYSISYAGGTGSTGSMSSETGIVAGSSQTLTAFNTIAKAGYTFSCWHADQDVTIGGSTVDEGDDIADGATIQNICGNITLTAQWTANTNTAYTVKHYQQNIADNNYTEVTGDRQNLTGTTDASVTPAVKSYTGFTAPSTQTVTILGDGSRVVDYYYTRNSYNLTWNLGGGTTTTAGTGIASGVSVNTTSSIKFGTSLTAPTVTKTGYGFSAWSPAKAATMPAEATSYTATWSATNYSITYNLNSGTNPGGAPTGFTIESSEITLPTPTRAGYRFDGWYANVGLTGDVQTTIPAGSTGNKTYWAKWTAKTDTYKTALHTGASGWTSYASGYTTGTSGAGYTIPTGAGNVTKGSGCEDSHYVFAGWVADEYKASPAGHIIAASGTTDATGTTYWAVWGDGVPTTTYTRLTSIAGIDESAQYVLGIDGTGFHYSGTSNWGLTALPANQTPLYYTLTKEDAATPTYFTAATSVSSTTYYLQVAGTGAFNMTTSSGTDAGKLVIGSTTNYGGDDKAYAVSVKGTTTKSLRRNGTSGIRCYDNTTTGSLVFFYKVVTSGDIDYVTSCCELKPATSVTVASTTGTSATLSWTAPSPTTGISKLQVRDASDDAVLVDNLLVSATGATVTGLTECDEYTFYVASVGATCYTASESVDAQPYSGAKTVTYKYHDDVTPDGSFTTDCSHPSTTLPNPSRTGYTLNGWYTAADGGTKKGNGGASYTPDADITLHAQWTEKPKYTITLNAGNGTVSADGWTAGVSPTWSKTQANGDEEITFPAANPGCAGWVFKGWKQGSAASDQASFTPDKTAGETLTPTSDVTYYAVYRQSTPSGTTYTKITESAALATGDYAIVANNSGTYEAMGNATSSSHMTETTAANDSWTNSNADYIWKILVFGSKVAFYNADEGKFLTIVNGAWVLADDGQLFTYSFNSTTKAWTFTSPSGKQIGYDTWFNVRDTQDDPVYLYKRGDAESGNYFTNPSCSDYTITGEANPVAGGSVQLTAAAAKNGDKVWACYTADEDYNFTNWSVSGTSVSPTSATTQFVEITVGSGNVTATANFAEKVMYDITWKANGETLTGDDLGSASVRVENGHNITALPPAPTSCETGSGKSENFIGWVVDDQNWSGKTNDLTGITIYKKLSEFPAVDDDVTYHAVWAATDESTNEWVKVTSIDGISDGDVVAIIRVDEAYYLPNAESDPAPAVAAVTKTSGDINFVNAMKFTATAESGGYIFESVSASGKYLWAYNDNKGIYIKATDGSKGGATNLWFLEDYDDYNETSTGYGIVLYCNTYTTENHYRYLATYGTTDWRSYGSVTASNLPANVYVYAHGYKDYMTKCCNTPTLAFTASPYAVLREDLGGASTTTWAEVDVTFTSNSTGTISAGTPYQLAASKWQVYETTGGTACVAAHATFEVLTQPSGVTPGTGKFRVKTNTAGTQTGQGTYRIAITQAATDAEHGNYCETTVYGFVDVTLRDKFVDNVNGNGTVNRDGHGAQLATPTLSEFGTQVEDACHEEGRKLKGWIKETDLKAQYETGNSTRVQTIDGLCESCSSASDQTSLIVTPGTNVTMSGATWYAVWAYEK